MQPSVCNTAAFLHGYTKIVSDSASERLYSGKLSLISNEDPYNLQKPLPQVWVQQDYCTYTSSHMHYTSFATLLLGMLCNFSTTFVPALFWSCCSCLETFQGLIPHMPRTANLFTDKGQTHVGSHSYVLC